MSGMYIKEDQRKWHVPLMMLWCHYVTSVMNQTEVELAMNNILACSHNPKNLLGKTIWSSLQNLNFDFISDAKQRRSYNTFAASAPVLCNFASLLQASEYSLWHWIKTTKILLKQVVQVTHHTGTVHSIQHAFTS